MKKRYNRIAKLPLYTKKICQQICVYMCERDKKCVRVRLHLNIQIIVFYLFIKFDEVCLH